MNFISPQRAANNQIHKNETQIDTREEKKLRHNTKVLEIKNEQRNQKHLMTNSYL